MILLGYLKPASNENAATAVNIQFCCFQYHSISLSALDLNPRLLGSRYCMFAGFVFRKFPTIQFRFLCILSGTLIKFIRLGTAVINLLDKLKRFSTELNFLQKQGAGAGVSDLSGSRKLQTDTFLYLFLIHSVFVYPEAIKFVGTLILAISVESL